MMLLFNLKKIKKMIKKFSLTDVVVLKENDILSCEQLSKVIGGAGVADCGCNQTNCGTYCTPVKIKGN
jgi:hypothetical protein